MTTQTATRHMGESRVDRVKSRFDLAEIVRRHGVALREGHRYSMGRCPFHDDSTPSFMVVNAERRYYCFGCGAAGDVIDFVKQACNLGSVKDVLDTLEGPTYRSSASAKPLPPPRKPEPPRERTPAERAVLLTYTKIAHATLMRSKQAVAGRNYLAERGVTTETARKIRLGFGLRGDLMAELVAAGHEPEAVRGSGVLICPKEEEGKPPRDPWPRFSRMITIPDVTSEGVGFIAGRGVAPGPTYKFQNIPGGKPVLGLARLRERKTSWCVATEGYLITLRWPNGTCRPARSWGPRDPSHAPTSSTASPTSSRRWTPTSEARSLPRTSSRHSERIGLHLCGSPSGLVTLATWQLWKRAGRPSGARWRLPPGARGGSRPDEGDARAQECRGAAVQKRSGAAVQLEVEPHERQTQSVR